MKDVLYMVCDTAGVT